MFARLPIHLPVQPVPVTLDQVNDGTDVEADAEADAVADEEDGENDTDEEGAEEAETDSRDVIEEANVDETDLIKEEGVVSEDGVVDTAEGIVDETSDTVSDVIADSAVPDEELEELVEDINPVEDLIASYFGSSDEDAETFTGFEEDEASMSDGEEEAAMTSKRVSRPPVKFQYFKLGGDLMMMDDDETRSDTLESTQLDTIPTAQALEVHEEDDQKNRNKKGLIGWLKKNITWKKGTSSPR